MAGTFLPAMSTLPASPGSTVGGWVGAESYPVSPTNLEAGDTPAGAASQGGGFEMLPSNPFSHPAGAGGTGGNSSTAVPQAGSQSSRALAATLALVQQSEELVASLKVGGGQV